MPGLSALFPRPIALLIEQTPSPATASPPPTPSLHEMSINWAQSALISRLLPTPFPPTQSWLGASPSHRCRKPAQWTDAIRALSSMDLCVCVCVCV